MSILLSSEWPRGKEYSYLIMTVELQIFLHLQGVRLRLHRLCFYPFSDVGEDLLRSEHSVGVEATIAVTSMSTSD